MATVSTDSLEPMCRVMEIPEFGSIGVGRFVATLGDSQAFRCGRAGTVVVAGTGAVPAPHRW